MATRKPAKPAPKAKAKPAAKPVAKPVTKPAAKAVAKPAIQPLSTHARLHVHTASGHDHTHHHHGDCCGSRKPLCACLCECCPVAKILFTRSFWAASVVAFIIIFATDWLLHTRYLMNDYAATSAFWRTDGEIRHSLIFITQAVTAMAYAAIVIGMGHASRWFGSFTAGALAAVPVAMSAMSAYIMMPFATAYIPTVWGIASVLQGGLAGLAICAALKASRAPEASADCCSHHTLH